VAYGDGLENRCLLTGTVGSNPTPSAAFLCSIQNKQIQTFHDLYQRVNQMSKSKFPLTSYKDERVVELVRKTDHKTLAVWAIDCVERVLPYFEDLYPEDHRPRNAIETLKTWIDTGIFKMSVIA
jgi:hypothetical protein